jgi:hypothetical protein
MVEKIPARFQIPNDMPADWVWAHDAEDEF